MRHYVIMHFYVSLIEFHQASWQANVIFMRDMIFGPRADSRGNNDKDHSVNASELGNPINKEDWMFRWKSMFAMVVVLLLLVALLVRIVLWDVPCF